MSLIMPDGKPVPQQGRSVEEFQSWAQNTFGRSANPMELQQIGSESGYGGSGPINEDTWAKAQQSATKMAQAQGWNPSGSGQPAAAKPSPAQNSQTQTINGVPLTYQSSQYTSNFNPTQFSQFVPGQGQQDQTQRNNLLSQLLANPQTMGQQWQDQMFETQKDSAANYAKQLGNQQAQGLAGRGLGVNGGAQRENQAQLQQDLMATLLGGRRDIATQAATQNRADELNVLNAANQTYQSQQDQALREYQAILAGQQAQSQQGQFAADLGLRGFGVNEASRQAASQSALDTGRFNFDIADTDRARQLQEFLGVVGAMMEQQRFGEGQRQFNSSLGLDTAKFNEARNQFGQTFGEGTRQFNMNFGEGQRQFNNQLGLNWSTNQNNQVGSFYDLISRLFGG